MTICWERSSLASFCFTCRLHFAFSRFVLRTGWGERLYTSYFLIGVKPVRVAQSVGHQTRKSGVLGSIPGLATYSRFSFRFFKKGSCQLLAKYVHEVLVNRLGGLSLPRKSVVRLTNRPDMTLDVYRGR